MISLYLFFALVKKAGIMCLMKSLLNIYKPVGVTPLQVIYQLREKFPEYRDVKIGYAGRLDPMARGVLVLMVGEAAKERDRYLGLEKEYVFEVLFGVETDTYDVLGVLDEGLSGRDQVIDKKRLELFVRDYPRNFLQAYPPFSSKAVHGRPLFWWSRQNRLSEIMIPSREVEIYEFEVLGMGEILEGDLRDLVNERINLVKGDFRQEKIREGWERFLKNCDMENFMTAKFKIRCSSGTYVRSLVHSMGEAFGTGAVALDIFRTRVGKYKVGEAIKIF